MNISKLRIITKVKDFIKWGENLKGRFVSGILTGSLLGATAGMYAITKMSSRQRRKIMKISRRIMMNLISSIGLF